MFITAASIRMGEHISCSTADFPKKLCFNTAMTMRVGIQNVVAAHKRVVLLCVSHIQLPK